jgi:hypothetical protein
MVVTGGNECNDQTLFILRQLFSRFYSYLICLCWVLFYTNIPGTLEYDRFDEIVEKSYIYSKPIVDEWVRKNPWLISSPKTNV